MKKFIFILTAFLALNSLSTSAQVTEDLPPEDEFSIRYYDETFSDEYYSIKVRYRIETLTSYVPYKVTKSSYVISTRLLSYPSNVNVSYSGARILNGILYVTVEGETNYGSTEDNDDISSSFRKTLY